MTVMLDSFFGMHQYVVRSGLWAKMKPGEKDLHIFLMAESERCCTREITATDERVTITVGAASRTLCNARKKLQEYGLIRYKAGPGNKYQYVICDPQMREPYPGDPREPIVVPKRGRGMFRRERIGVDSSDPGSAAMSDQQNLPIRDLGLPGLFP